MEETRNIQQALDLAIRNSEGAEQKSGYEVGGRKYPNYLSKKEFEEFIKEMKKTSFYKQYKDADGGELEEKRGRWGLYPPKMSCFGSSSRFIFRLLRTTKGVEFEKKLPTKVGGKANLDAHIKGICEIFIEAKCREIYSGHNSTEISECYEDVFKYLARKLDRFEYRRVGDSTKTNYSKYSIYYNDRQIKRFDIKQLICHFLGISASVLEDTTKTNIKFIYLIFNPNSVAEHIEKYKEKILDQYAEALAEIRCIDMKALFNAIFEYQKECRKIDYSGQPKFEFVVADQTYFLHPFVHLHTHTEYSLSDGIAKIPQLVDKAMADGMPGMAITDHANMFGVAEFVHYVERKNQELGTTFKPIVGCEVYVARRGMAQKGEKEDFGGYHLVLLAKDRTGYKNLVKIVSRSWLEGYYGRPRTDHAELERLHEGLICCSACIGGEVAQHILNNDKEAAERAAGWYKRVFGEDYYLELQYHKPTVERANHETHKLETRVNAALVRLSGKLGIKLICSNDVHYVNEEDAEVQDSLLCINWGKRADDPNRLIFSKQEWLKTTAEMNDLFGHIPEALENTMEIFDKVERYPINLCPKAQKLTLPEGIDEVEHLARLAFDGAYKHYGKPLPTEEKEGLKAELRAVNSHHYAPLVLMWHEIVSAARELGAKMGNDRGFAKSSLLLYCLGITQERPTVYGEAFCDYINLGQGLPALECEFDREGRERVLKWIVERYSEQSIANIASRNVFTAKTATKGELQAEKLVGVLRKMDIHSCGVAICEGDISERVPLVWVESAEYEDAVVVTQYRGDALRRIGVPVLYFLTANTLHDDSEEETK